MAQPAGPRSGGSTSRTAGSTDTSERWAKATISLLTRFTLAVRLQELAPDHRVGRRQRLEGLAGHLVDEPLAGAGVLHRRDGPAHRYRLLLEGLLHLGLGVASSPAPRRWPPSEASIELDLATSANEAPRVELGHHLVGRGLGVGDDLAHAVRR